MVFKWYLLAPLARDDHFLTILGPFFEHFPKNTQIAFFDHFELILKNRPVRGQALYKLCPHLALYSAVPE